MQDTDGLGDLSYVWLRDGSEISGATQASYGLVQADVNAAISLRVSYADGFGTRETVTSNVTGPVTNFNDPAQRQPALIGAALQGGLLETDAAALADADGLGRVDYQWLRGGRMIDDATERFYQLTQADVDQTVAVRVSYTDNFGTSETATSAATPHIENVNDPVQGAVTISGFLIEDANLSVSIADLSDIDGLWRLSYQWLRNGEAVTYTPTTTGAYTLG